MSYKFDMSEYEKPLRPEVSGIDADVSISAAKETALKNIDIAEKYIKKVSTKATDEQKRYISERIASAKREISEASKGLIPNSNEPYLLPTANDLGKDKQESNVSVEKQGKFKTIHFIRKELPTLGSGQSDLFDIEIPSDALRRIQEAEQRVIKDVESIVKGNEKAQEVTRTIYVENEQDPALRAQINALQFQNVDLQNQVDQLTADLEYQQQMSDELKAQVDGHILTIQNNDLEIERLVKILYGKDAQYVPGAKARRLPIPVRGQPRLGVIAHAAAAAPGEIMVMVPGLNANNPFVLGTVPHGPFDINVVPDGLFNQLANEIADRKADITKLEDELENKVLDGVQIPQVDAPVAGGVPSFAGAPGGLPKGLRSRAKKLREMVDELTSMIETPKVLAAMATDRAQEIADYKSNTVTAKAAYEADVAAYQQNRRAVVIANLWNAYKEYQTYMEWYIYEEEKAVRDNLDIISTGGHGTDARKAAKDILAGRNGNTSPWKTLKELGVPWAQDIEESGIDNTGTINIKNRALITNIMIAALPAPTARPGALRPGSYLGIVVPAAGRMDSVRPVTQPIPKDPGIVVPMTDPAIAPLSAAVNAELKGNLASGTPGHPINGAAFLTAINLLVEPAPLTPTIGGFRDQLKAMTAQRDSLTRSLITATTDLAAMTADRDRLNGLLTASDAALLAMTALRDQLNKELVDTAANLAVALNTISRLQQEMSVITASVNVALTQSEVPDTKSGDLTNINAIGQKAADLIAQVNSLTVDVSNLTTENTKLTRALKRKTEELERIEKEMTNLQAALTAININWDGTRLSGAGFTALKLAKRGAAKSASYQAALASAVLPSQRLAGKLPPDTAKLADAATAQLLAEQKTRDDLQSGLSAGTTIAPTVRDKVHMHLLNTLQRSEIIEEIVDASITQGLAPRDKENLMKYLEQVGLPSDISLMMPFIKDCIKWYQHGRTGDGPNPKTYVRSAAAAAGVTGGGYFDGGDFDYVRDIVNDKGRLKRGGDDTSDSDSTDVMLTAGVGGAVGSVMWLGWGGLVIFLLLLFIYYLSSNIYYGICDKDVDYGDLRKYHRNLHRRQ